MWTGIARFFGMRFGSWWGEGSGQWAVVSGQWAVGSETIEFWQVM
jgi:hypothetical protein